MSTRLRVRSQHEGTAHHHVSLMCYAAERAFCAAVPLFSNACNRVPELTSAYVVPSSFSCQGGLEICTRTGRRVRQIHLQAEIGATQVDCADRSLVQHDESMTI